MASITDDTATMSSLFEPPAMPYIGHWTREKMLAELCEVTKKIASLEKEPSDDKIVKQLEHSEKLLNHIVESLVKHQGVPVGRVKFS